jgi:hypothetical protein
MAAANLRATAAEVAVEEAWPDLHPEKQVQVVVQPVCHVTQVPLAVLPQGLAGAAAGAAHSGASLDSDGASSSSSTGGSGGSEAAADALQVTGYMVPRCGSSIRNLVVPVHSDAPWRYGNVQLADKPNVVFATQALADAAAAAAGVAAVPVLLEEVQGVRSLPQFHPGSPFLTNTVRAVGCHQARRPALQRSAEKSRHKRVHLLGLFEAKDPSSQLACIPHMGML